MPEKTERALRAELNRDGYIIRKSRRKTPTLDDFGGYMVLDARMNVPVLGYRWDADLDDIEEWMRA